MHSKWINKIPILRLKHGFINAFGIEYRLISKKGEGTFSEVLKA